MAGSKVTWARTGQVTKRPAITTWLLSRRVRVTARENAFRFMREVFSEGNAHDIGADIGTAIPRQHAPGVGGRGEMVEAATAEDGRRETGGTRQHGGVEMRGFHKVTLDGRVATDAELAQDAANVEVHGLMGAELADDADKVPGNGERVHGERVLLLHA